MSRKIRSLSIHDVAEAMRKNGWPQIHNGRYFDEVGACAIGQASRNLDVDTVTICLILASSMRFVTCPDSEGHSSHWWTYGESLDSVVIHLNDNHKWPLKRIADWLDTLNADN